ncbi:Transposase [Rubripirellula obstinata]|uniref:Transposase n=1 Tax=Rubripirellula obstinata TaxID=406547 RepID=A0A5B1CTD3_9BACT|nr:transposase [Rubripirellula obstinata]KAA1262484.1 Transposase [Rubripirellula obstinata]
MTTTKNSTRNKGKKGATRRYIGKPSGVIQQRVQEVGPQRFGIVSVDCAKRRSKCMFCDFFGRVIIEPTIVEHHAGALKAMTQQVAAACEAEGIGDSIAAVEMTGIYHKPVQAAFRKAGFDTRTVHPFASSHYRGALHPNDKTDDNDLEAIFHAAINGYGLATLPVSEIYLSLQRLIRHRRNLVKQRARLQVQIRALLHQSMPGFADLFEDDKLFNKSIAMTIAQEFSSADSIKKIKADGMATFLRNSKVRFQERTLDKIYAWSLQAADADPLHRLLTEHWKQLLQLRSLMTEQILDTERKTANSLAKTPYILLLSVKGINIVSAGELAGEAGPPEHYASATAINGRAGLYPSRYQSDEVDRSGSVAKSCNRRLRAACILVAKNLIKCHPYYRGLSAVWEKRGIVTVDRQCRMANRANRMIFQIVSGRQVWRGKSIDQEYILLKLREFHRTHKTTLEQTVVDLNEAFTWLPKSTHAAEAKPLAELARKKNRRTASIGDLLIRLLIRLGVRTENPVESRSSEA